MEEVWSTVYNKSVSSQPA